MGQRGPARVPTAILKARGSRLAEGRSGEVQYGDDVPDCPAFLDPEAIREWDRMIKELTKADVWQTVDRAILACWCEAWAEFAACVYALSEMKRANPTEWYVSAINSGLNNVKNKAVERLGKIAQQLGFTPAARSRVQAAERGEDDASDKSKFFS